MTQYIHFRVGELQNANPSASQFHFSLTQTCSDFAFSHLGIHPNHQRMQLQSHPFPNNALSPPIFSPSAHFFPNTKHLSNPSFNYRFCSLKRVSKSSTNLRNSEDLSSVRCEVLLINSSFKSGFCTSLKRVSKSRCGMRKSGGLIGFRCEVLPQNMGDDGYYMRRSVELARKAIGCTSPNPMVGCIIVKDGKIVGEGFHPKAGQPHAEVFALRDAGDLAENATAYVSLEPCNHYGRTPPCTEAMIKAKVKKVVVGMVDPNPIVASKGVDRLRDAGIDVTVGVEEELCKKLNEAYIHQMLTGKPFVTLRYSLSVNGHFLDQLGEGVAESGGYYSQLLQEYDAIILSPSSFTEQSSFPVSQELGANQPLQILLVRTPNSPIQIPVLTTEATSKVIIFTDKETAVEPETAKKGIETVVLEQINLNTILEYCKRRGLCSVLLDLRGNFSGLEELLEECLEQNLLQKVVIEVLPLWDGSGNERLPVALKNLPKTLRLKNLTSRISNESIVLEGYF